MQQHLLKAAGFEVKVLMDISGEAQLSPVSLLLNMGMTRHSRPGHSHISSFSNSAGHESRAAGHNADQGAVGDDV